jgi:hypothetical protein
MSRSVRKQIGRERLNHARGRWIKKGRPGWVGLLFNMV